MTRWMRPITSVIAALLALVLLFGCSAQGQTTQDTEDAPTLQEPVGLKHDYAPVVRQTVSRVLSVDGYVRPTVLSLHFESDGYVEAAAVHTGAEVEAGDVLAILDEASLDAQLEGLEAEIELAEQEGQAELRLLELAVEAQQARLDSMLSSSDESFELSRGVLPAEQAVEVVRLDLRQAERAYERYANDLEQTTSDLSDAIADVHERMASNTLIAPFDGRVLAILNEGRGAQIQAGESYLELIREDEAYVETEYIPDMTLREADQVTAYIDGKAYPLIPRSIDHRVMIDRAMAGRPMYSEHDFDPGKPEDVTLGSWVQLQLTSQTQEDVLTVPVNALYRSGGEVYVYRLAGEQREHVVVDVLYETETVAIIESGLVEGDQVYVKDS